MGVRVRAGSFDDLKRQGFLTAKAGGRPVCVFWHGGAAYALDDRCPHMGFPLHRGTLDDGLVTCHWHHARFDLASGGTLDPFADDARCYGVEIEDGAVVVVVGEEDRTSAWAARRLEEGLEQGLTLVMAKAVLGLMADPSGVDQVARTGVRFGTSYRSDGWGSGLTVFTIALNALEWLRPQDRALALVHGLSFVSRDTRGRSPRFPLAPLDSGSQGIARLSSWYRRFIETRSADAAERTLATAIDAGHSTTELSDVMLAATTDHAFLDGGHTIDFTNKAFEAVGHLGEASKAEVLPTLVAQTARATRQEETGSWRHPHDLARLVSQFCARLPELLERGARSAGPLGDEDVAKLGWALLADDPAAVIDALQGAVAGGATPEQLGRGVAYAAGLRIVRFHVQNDHGDWDVVHHGFTAANALHQLLVRSPSPELMRGAAHVALKVYLDRFLNVPAARLPDAAGGDLGGLQACWDAQGMVDEAGRIVYGHLTGGGDRRAVAAALGQSLFAEDSEFHWFQTYEAGVRQALAWPAGSEESALLLAGVARFLAAHTPTRRELPQVVTIATRLLRGEELFEET